MKLLLAYKIKITLNYMKPVILQMNQQKEQNVMKTYYQKFEEQVIILHDITKNNRKNLFQLNYYF